MSDRVALTHISPDRVVRNPENPRIFFRADELDVLISSIRRYGIQVPVTVYKEGSKFVLIDGERRWRCAKKLNLKAIPALVQEKPSDLQNLLLMFNIHSLREQWDYFTIANKLPRVIELFEDENDREPNEIELSDITGLTRGQIRRCRLLIDLPKKYKSKLIEELYLPKNKQVLSEDFFIEMERALKAIENRFPNLIKKKDEARDVLITKYRKHLISSVTDFRKLSKIATSASNLKIDEREIAAAIGTILDEEKKVGIQELFVERFETKYDQRKIYLNVEAVLDYLKYTTKHQEVKVDATLRNSLTRLRKLIDEVLGD